MILLIVLFGFFCIFGFRFGWALIRIVFCVSFFGSLSLLFFWLSAHVDHAGHWTASAPVVQTVQTDR